MTTLGNAGDAFADRGSGIPAGERYPAGVVAVGLDLLLPGVDSIDMEAEELGDGVVRDSEGVRVVGRAYVWPDGLRRATLRNLSKGDGCNAYFRIQE